MASGSPILSVIMPAYNVEKYIKESVVSILNQTFTDFEVLIADDGSNDRTREIIDSLAKSDLRIKVAHNEYNLGKTGTVQKLYQLATGKYITIHDADDVSLSQRFSLQMKAFQQDDELVLCGTSFLTIDADGFVIGRTRMPGNYDEIYNNILNESQFHGPTMIVRKEVLDELGEIYRPFFRDNFEDTDLAARIIDKHKGYNLNDYLYVYRILPHSLCRRKVDVRNRNLYRVVSYLSQQRRSAGNDSLMQNNEEELTMFLRLSTAHYEEDPALIHRQAAAYFFYYQLYRQAIQEALKGIRVRPWKLVNVRTLLYVLRKMLVKLITNVKTHYTEVL